MTETHEPTVISGLSLITARGATPGEVWRSIVDGSAKPKAESDYSLVSFRAVNYLSDRRMMKAITQTHAVGLAAVELAQRDAGYQKGDYDSWRLGMYVGAPQAGLLDNKNYIPALKESADEYGEPSVRAFGKHSMSSRPITLLEGLPNNVLCYGSIVLEAQGANSNYTSGEVSGHLSIINAAKRIERGQADAIVAGAYSGPTDPFMMSTFRQQGWLKPCAPEAEAHQIAPSTASGTILGDGAAFVWLESTEAASAHARTVKLLCHGGDTYGWGFGPSAEIVEGQADELGRLIANFLASRGLSLAGVGLTFVSGTGLDHVDRFEEELIKCLAAKGLTSPVATLGSELGNLMEASGLAEIALAPEIYQHGELPGRLDAHQLGMRLPSETNVALDPSRRLTLIVRSSIWGETSFLVVEPTPTSTEG